MRAQLASDAAAVPQDGAGSGSSTAGPAGGQTLLTAIALLTVAEERPDGYDRDLFRYGIGVDGNGCSTRERVLLDEAIAAPTVGEPTGRRCELTGGTWYSYYDGQVYLSPDDVEVDHVVPLAEAWRSGAYTWAEDRLQDFGNDLTDSRTLVVVEKSLNEAKVDQEPGVCSPRTPVHSAGTSKSGSRSRPPGR